MNYADMKKEFLKKYGGEESNIRVFGTSSCITVLGNGFESCFGEYFAIPLSVGTYVCIRVNDSGIFSLKFSDCIEEYECEYDRLLDYKENNDIKEIFRTIAFSREKINGANILYINNTDALFFKGLTSAVASAFSVINNGKITDDFSSRIYYERMGNGSCVISECEFFGRKNMMFHKKRDGSIEYFPFDVTGYKLIAAVKDFKDNKVSEKIYKAYCELLKENKECFKEPEQYIDRYKNDKFKRYIIDESIRINKLKIVFYEKKRISDYGDIFKEAAYGYLKLSDKNVSALYDLYDTAYDLKECELVFHMFKIGGICALVRNANTDKFIKEFSKEYEKKAGAMPALYICDSENSGVEIKSDIESE